MVYKGKYTKNEFKKKVRSMNYAQLKQLYEDINLQLSKAKVLINKKQNPYEYKKKSHVVNFNVKLLHWQKALLTQELHKATNL